MEAPGPDHALVFGVLAVGAIVQFFCATYNLQNLCE